MIVEVMDESGYEPAAYGFSLSWNTTIARAKQLMPAYAFMRSPGGEDKFMRVIHIWIRTDIPRFQWSEGDQYKVAATTLSESTMHTLGKRDLVPEDFYPRIDADMLVIVNRKIGEFRRKEIGVDVMKAHLPEGFLQERVWEMSYATLQNIINQRSNHRLPQWKFFVAEIRRQVQHPELLWKATNG